MGARRAIVLPSAWMLGLQPKHLVVAAASVLVVAALPWIPRHRVVDVTIAPRVDIVLEAESRFVSTWSYGTSAYPTLELRATGYNSLEAQTDSTPNVTATGTTTRPGVLAASRDLLATDLPYGSLVRLVDLGTFYEGRNVGRFQSILDAQGLFVVEDTMHARKTQQIDVWFGDVASAVNWGVRRVGVAVVRYGFDGPILDEAVVAAFDGSPVLIAATPPTPR